MSLFRTSTLLGIGLAAGLTFDAQAQTPGPSVATLPPPDQGPRASSHLSIPGSGSLAVSPSPAYVGPAPGAITGTVPPRFEKSADWDANPAMKPYDPGKGPRPN
jgi:hypothetical protein